MSRTFSEVVAGSRGSPVEECWLRKFQEEDEAEALEKAVKLSKVRSSIQYCSDIISGFAADRC